MGNVWKIVDIHPFLSTIDRRQERLLMNLSNTTAMQSGHDDVIVMRFKLNQNSFLRMPFTLWDIETSAIFSFG